MDAQTKSYLTFLFFVSMTVILPVLFASIIIYISEKKNEKFKEKFDKKDYTLEMDQEIDKVMSDNSLSDDEKGKKIRSIVNWYWNNHHLKEG